jgi:hypothetical protein
MENRIRPGVKVHWVKISHRRREVSMVRQDGTVVSVEGDQAVVKRISGRNTTVPISQLRIEGEQGHIDEFVRRYRNNPPIAFPETTRPLNVENLTYTTIEAREPIDGE